MNVTARMELNRDGGEFAATVFRRKPIYEKEKPKSIAGLTSGQIRKAKTSGHEARRLNAPTLMNNGGTESHDTLYGKSDQDYEADGNDLSRIYELPEMMPDQFMGAAGLASKDVFRQAARPFMFGEKTADGLEYGAKHIADLYAPPNAAQLNSAFMQTSHWFEPDQDGQRPMTQEELEQANAAHELAEESRRHALYQSYASYGSDHPVGEEAGAQYYEGHYSNAQSDQHGSGMYPPGRSPPQSRENLPKWAQPQHPPGGQPPRDNGPLPPPRQSRIRRLTSDGAAPPPPHRSRHSSRPLPCLRRDGAPAGAAHEARGSHPLGPCQRVAPSLSATAQSLPSHQTSLRRAPSPPGRLRMYRGRGVVRRRSLAVGAARPVGWAAMRTLRRGWRARRATAANAASAATAAERGAEACGLCAGGCVIG